MTFFEAIISGIVQGLTEFLPISSSGHLVVLHNLFGLKEPQFAFDIFLHLGTLVAIFIVFWKDILSAVTTKKRIGLFILLGTLSTAIFVMAFGKGIEAAFSNVKLVGSMLMLTGVWLIFGSFVRFGTSNLSGLKAMLIGVAQGIAILPGISRSGATISTALFLGIDAKSSARFSFLLSIPAIAGAVLLQIKNGSFTGFNTNCIFGFVISCIVGVVSLKWLLRVLYKNKLHLFGIYCILAGILVLVFLR